MIRTPSAYNSLGGGIPPNGLFSARFVACPRQTRALKPPRRGYRRQSRRSTRLDSRPEAAYHAARDASSRDASKDRATQRGGVMDRKHVLGEHSRDPGGLLPLTPVTLNIL